MKILIFIYFTFLCSIISVNAQLEWILFEDIDSDGRYLITSLEG